MPITDREILIIWYEIADEARCDCDMHTAGQVKIVSFAQLGITAELMLRPGRRKHEVS